MAGLDELLMQLLQGTLAGGGGSGGSNTPWKAIPGYGYDLQDRQMAFDSTKQMRELNLALQKLQEETRYNTGTLSQNAKNQSAQTAQWGASNLLERQSQQMEAQLNANRIASAEKIASLDRQTQLEIAKGNNASQERIAAMQAEIGRETNRLRSLEVQIQQAAEARQERDLQSRLAANPADFVQYEFYKRALNSAGMGGSAGAGGTAAPPAYSDTQLKQVANSLFNPDTKAMYNPNLSGQGVFGATIQAPNQVSRAEFGNLSDSEKAILGSFLKGGINMGGKMTALDPGDFSDQMMRSWIPTITGEKQGTQYS